VNRFVVLVALASALLSLIGRALLTAAGAVSFHADEAVVALMARHILEGARPIFFYGQAYMGGLDAYLTALGFAVLGESVMTVRLVQMILYALVVLASCGLAYRLTGSRGAVTIVGVLHGFAPALLTLYSTATLGGYNETLLFGALLLWLTFDVTGEYPRSRWRWLLLGLTAGIGWWTNFLIAVYALPAAILIVQRLVRGDRRAVVTGIGLALGAFMIGSLPFWDFNLREGFASFGFLFNLGDPSRFASLGAASPPPLERLIAFAFIGLPALIGLRFPWSAGYFLLPIGVLVGALLTIGVVVALRSAALTARARLTLGVWLGGFAVIFLLSRFSADPTGRYFLPIYLPLTIAFAVFALSARRALAVILTGALALYFTAGVIAAAAAPPGLTTQFNLIEHLPNEDDAALIAFLDEQGITAGYSSYWIAFRIAFLSGERIVFDPVLPPKPDLAWTPFYRRYPPYTERAAAAERSAYVTANVPEVETALEAWFAGQGIAYRRTTIGIYVVYHDFAPRIPRPPLPFVRLD
jgi:4-amino-4-deoxy-L-arabinose transferase-like glycosyltransferase